MFSMHAEKRMKQRGFHKLDAELILSLGIPESAPGGGTKYTLPRKVVEDLVRSLNRMRNGATAIMNESGLVQTMYKDYSR